MVPVGRDETVDLTEVVRQHLVLAVPIAPRCGDGCRGLCDTCGADLNERQCECPPPERDHRWAALDQLRVDAD